MNWVAFFTVGGMFAIGILMLIGFGLAAQWVEEHFSPTGALWFVGTTTVLIFALMAGLTVS